MSLSDYLFPALLIFSVVRQVRGRHLSLFGLAWPVGLVIWAGASYLHGFPAGGHDFMLVIATAASGAVLGLLAGVFTLVYRRADGALMAQATAATIVLWVLGTAGRLAFGLYAEHGGGPHILSLSHSLGIAVTAWAPALILMALCEVLGRTLVLGLRALSASRADGPRGGRRPQQPKAASGARAA